MESNYRNDRKIKNASYNLKTLLVFLFIFGAGISAASSAEVRIDPAFQTVETGKDFTVNISIDPINNPTTAAQFNLLFNSSIVNVKSVAEGNLFTQNGAITLFNPGTLNNSRGTLSNAWGLIIIPGANVATKGTLATITMDAKASGSSPLILDNVIVSDPDSQAAQVNVTNGSVKVQAYDITPPASIANLKKISNSRYYINWTWTEPKDTDFAKVMVYINGNFKTNVSKGIRFYKETNLIPNTRYTIGTHTVDASGNINKTWINQTVKTAIRS